MTSSLLRCVEGSHLKVERCQYIIISLLLIGNKCREYLHILIYRIYDESYIRFSSYYMGAVFFFDFISRFRQNSTTKSVEFLAMTVRDLLSPVTFSNVSTSNGLSFSGHVIIWRRVWYECIIICVASIPHHRNMNYNKVISPSDKIVHWVL